MTSHITNHHKYFPPPSNQIELHINDQDFEHIFSNPYVKDHLTSTFKDKPINKKDSCRAINNNNNNMVKASNIRGGTQSINEIRPQKNKSNMRLSNLKAFMRNKDNNNLSNEIKNPIWTNKDHQHNVNCKNINDKDKDPSIDSINNNNTMKNKYLSKRKIINFDSIIHKPQNNSMQDREEIRKDKLINQNQINQNCKHKPDVEDKDIEKSPSAKDWIYCTLDASLVVEGIRGLLVIFTIWMAR
ncbi:uncharacterized protein LOC127102612 [Lathyrus oleraceus]|uniref:uncharacterized protein LOC127102612 n=1 Tax=Pisum sativum TaxID=3888 RepID=UPI0021CE7177|nr:uncharacterized protein LOC127102612 [Pisum sativum]